MKLTFTAVLIATTYAQDPTWIPGDFSDGNIVEDTVRGTKIYLSNGLMGKAIAWSGEPVIAADGTNLAAAYHQKCDGGAAFANPNGDGYYYVSNSEKGSYPDDLSGGTYALQFSSDHRLLGYNQILSGTALNCHGGVTAWDTWISCEEHREFGRCWQVDPTGTIPAKVTDLTGVYGMTEFGNWEAFAWDDESNPPRGYVTNDDFPDDSDASLPKHRGAVVRYTPDATALACLASDTFEGKWCGVDSGSHDFLKLTPATDGSTGGTFEWVENLEDTNPQLYGGSEGAHVESGILTFSTVLERYLFRLNLADMTYTRSAIPFKFEPDNLRVLGDRLYLCSDGDEQQGDAVWGWDDKGAYRIFYEENHQYPAGVDFTPDNKMMYVSMYGEATWQFWRADGLAFDAPTAGIVYEVDGGVGEGKTHAEIADQVNSIVVGTSGGGTSTGTTTNGGGGTTATTSSVGNIVSLMAGLIPLATQCVV